MTPYPVARAVPITFDHHMRKSRITHHSTGPAQKAAQAGEFKRYGSLK